MDYLEELNKGLYLLPAQASEFAARVDTQYLVLVFVCGVLTLAVFVLVIYFSVRYRAGSKVERVHSATERARFDLELGWTLALLLVFLALFAWSVPLYLEVYRGPEASTTIDIVGKQWMWKAQHPDGTREINTLHVPRGETIRLRLTSQDVIHSFYVPALRLKRDAVPGMYTSLWFTAARVGEYHLFCAEYCGTDHSRMRGKVVVLSRADYQDWLTRNGSGDSPVVAGRQLFQAYGCAGCHMGRSAVRAPSLAGVYGRTVPLADGTTVVADEAYLRDSVLLPDQHVVAGFAPIMPSFSGEISEGELQNIIAYIKSLRPGDWERGMTEPYRQEGQ